MKNLKTDPESVSDSVVILRCRDLRLSGVDRQELHRSEVAFGHVFQKIHRIEWHLSGLIGGVEATCRIRSRTGEFAAEGGGVNTRAALQVVTDRILKQKRRAKETSVSRRRAAPRRSKAE